MTYARIAGTGSYLPEKVLTNADLDKMVDTTDEWIRSAHRHPRSATSRAEGETTSDLGLRRRRARAARPPASIAADIDLIVVGTTTPDIIFPSTACLLQHRLGANGCAGLRRQRGLLRLHLRAERSPTSSSAAGDVQERAGDRRRNPDPDDRLERSRHLRAVRRRRRRGGAQGRRRDRHPVHAPACRRRQARICCTTRSACRSASSRRAERRRARCMMTGNDVFKSRSRRSMPWSTKPSRANGLDKPRPGLADSAPGQPAHHRSDGQAPGHVDGQRHRHRRPARQHLVRLGAAGAGRGGAHRARSSAASCCCSRPSAAASPGARR